MPVRTNKNQIINIGFSLKAWRTIKKFAGPSLLLLLSSCYDNPDPAFENLENYRFFYTTTAEVGAGGEYLSDSIYVTIYNMTFPEQAEGFRVEFQVSSGGGSVDQSQLITNPTGRAATKWKLGTESFKQALTARILDPQAKLLQTIGITAYAILPASWNEVDFYPVRNIRDLAADTLNHASWMIAGSIIFKQGANFLDWIPLHDTGISSPFEIETDENGLIYAGTWNGELYRSTGQGAAWTKCADPISGRSAWFYFWITGDGDLWATAHEQGVWHSSNGGASWQHQGTDPDILNGVFRLKDGSLLSLKGNPQTIKKSDDNGQTWAPLSTATPAYPYCFYVTQDDNIIVCSQGSPVRIYKSSDGGVSFRQVHAVPVSLTTGSYQSYFHRYGSWYYFAVPGYGVLKTRDFEQFETMLNQPEINSLYLDHTGSLAARGFLGKQNSTFYYNNQ